MANTPEIGSPAPDFTLPSLELVDGEARRDRATLSAQRGHPVVIAFYPGDDTAVCTRQMCAYSNDLDVFRELDAVVWGISPQDLDSHESFARKYSLGFPLLADVDRAVIRAYGVTGILGQAVRRSVFVVDADGIVRWRHVGLVGVTFPSAATIAAQVKAAQAA
jgi:peroxiredoxin Q/BCP